MKVIDHKKIKISSNEYEWKCKWERNFCPFKTLRNYLELRGPYESDEESLFIFRDMKPVTAEVARRVLRKAIQNLHLNPLFYDMHSFRIGRSTDLAKMNYTIDEIKHLGRWKSNVVYKYIR